MRTYKPKPNDSMTYLKPILLFILFAVCTDHTHAQKISGSWNGLLNVMGNQIELSFHIQSTDSGYIANFDSPRQGAFRIPFTSVTYTPPNLKLTANNIAAVYTAELVGDSLFGTWIQSGQSFELIMSKNKVARTAVKRPQNPKKPYPYVEKFVSIENTVDSLTLSGTITIPENDGPHPAVVLISGSGPQNRDEEIFGHKPFLVLADHLTRNGIAVLRYDDRGTTESTGNFGTATSQAFARDVLFAIDFLKQQNEIDVDKMGLIGHSEGGLIAPMVANQSADVAFIIMLAGTGVPGKEIALMQAQTIMPRTISDSAAYLDFTKTALQIASAEGDTDMLKKRLTQHYHKYVDAIEEMLPEGADVASFINRQVEQSLSPWSRFFYNYDPATELSKVKIPLLSLIGSKDVQVPPEMNHPPIREALNRAGNEQFTLKELEGLNHMFQESQTGNISEYAQIEQTFSPRALKEITFWITHTIQNN